MTKHENKLLADWLLFSQVLTAIDGALETSLKNRNNLTLKEFYVLHFLAAHPSKKMRLQDLQEKVGLSQSALSRLVSRMEEKEQGVINRHICSDDKRGIYISITPLGEEKAGKAEQTVNQLLAVEIKKKPLAALIAQLASAN
ncbi:MarR family winged helix-turn-helix transcriptional regulator [Enterococcus sp. LJL128]|uniref:MarR family winged helix-turn-helix transcriptional regulator n=1 Tax=Enterococcus sp. LJL51 TaxID=3416656 RepID=UPI003CFA38F7